MKRRFSSSATPSPPWIELPEHVTADILQRLYSEEIIGSAQYVCTTWWRVCQNPATWCSIDLDYRRPAAFHFGEICRCGGFKHGKICRGGLCQHDHICRCSENKFNYLVRRAVDLSQGQLLHLKIVVWNLNGLQNYVADRLVGYDATLFIQMVYLAAYLELHSVPSISSSSSSLS
ncbi:putative F-box/LRR-repeat protein 23 [Salvia splendens]|uniref:putative F-box/LRR-repeat protein 23 n=1 Tax=Salvia splendens TaxID=180675 RepID=UPI001C25FCEA|nr:putative F-box/LRR-repeat protein 23 [Salvia splendens]